MAIHNVISSVLERSRYALNFRIHDVDNEIWDCHFTWIGRPNYDFTLRIEKDSEDEYTIWVKNSNQQTWQDYLHLLRFVNILDANLNGQPWDEQPSPIESVG